MMWLGQRHQRHRFVLLGLAMAVFITSACMMPRVLQAQPIGADDNPYDIAIDQLIAEILARPDFRAMVLAHNKEAQAWSQSEIAARDQRWRKGDATVIDPVLGNALSNHLKAALAGTWPKVAEIIVTGVRGCNIAVSPKTTDYWQGDEAKFLKTLGAENRDFFADTPEFDESAGTFLQQISKQMTHNGQPVGVITVGFDLVQVRAKPSGAQ